MINTQLLNEYRNKHSIFNTDDIRVIRLKDILFNHLTENECNLFILYLECNCRYKKFIQLSNTDLSTARNYIKRIRQKIRMKYDELYNDD